MAQFKVGDTVQLKSGGPVMTVSQIQGNGDVACMWFVDAARSTGVFPADTLEIFESSGGI